MVNNENTPKNLGRLESGPSGNPDIDATTKLLREIAEKFGPQPEVETKIKTAPENETPGHRGERVVLEFLEKSQIGFTHIEETTPYDRNDRDGIDAIGGVEGCGKVAIDVTFDADERRLLEKINRNLRNPIAFAHDKQGRAINQQLPRLLIRGADLRDWLDMEKQAQDRGVKLITGRGKSKIIPDIGKRQRTFLKQMLEQIKIMSGLNSDYAKAIEPAKRVFQQHFEEIGE